LPTNPVPYPEVVCPCGLCLSLGVLLFGAAGMGFGGRRPPKILLPREVVGQKFRGNSRFIEICAILPTIRQLV